MIKFRTSYPNPKHLLKFEVLVWFYGQSFILSYNTHGFLTIDDISIFTDTHTSKFIYDLDLSSIAEEHPLLFAFIQDILNFNFVYVNRMLIMAVYFELPLYMDQLNMKNKSETKVFLARAFTHEGWYMAGIEEIKKYKKINLKSTKYPQSTKLIELLISSEEGCDTAIAIIESN